jgi:hypothetical protein
MQFFIAISLTINLEKYKSTFQESSMGKAIQLAESLIALSLVVAITVIVIAVASAP